MSKHRATKLVLFLLFIFLSFSSKAWGQIIPALDFLDEHGAVTSTYVEGSRAFVRLAYGDNVAPAEETFQVELATSRAGDVELLTVARTGPGSGTYLGSIPLELGAISQPGVLETATDPNPPYDRDTITASYDSGAVTATASMVGSKIWFLDGYGRVRQSFAVGERVHVRIADFLRSNPSFVDSFEITVADPVTFDQERVYLVETGADTGIFEGSVATTNGFTPTFDGVLGTGAGYTIVAEHQDADLPTSSQATAQMLVSIVELVDSQGRPAEYYLESTRVYVQVEDHLAGSPSVVNVALAALQTDISSDHEDVILTETGPSTGIYRSSLALRQGSGIPNNGLVEISYDGPPYRFDTVRATSESGSSTDAVGIIGSLTSFVDAYGNEVETYPVGVAVRVRVEDHNFNNPAALDTVGVTVSSLATGDSEGLTLLEVAKDSGIFEGYLATQVHAPNVPNDGYFPMQAGHEIEAMHVDLNGVLASGDRARIEAASIRFVDEAGRPTVELLENGTARVRVINFDGNGNHFQVDGLMVQLRSLKTGDQENLPLAETGPDTSIFEGAIQLSYNLSAIPGNGQVETSNPPPYTGDEVTASYGPFSATAHTVGGRMVFIDAFGRETSTIPVGSPVRVRVASPASSSPTGQAFIFISLDACQSDQETLQLYETGVNTGVFEGEIPSADQSPTPFNGILQGMPSCVLQAFFSNPNGSQATPAVARFTGGEVLFVDAQGQPASVFLEGTRAYLRVVDHGRSGSVPVTVTADLSGDQEPLMLPETSPESGVFVGSIELRSSPSGIFQNGILETSQASGPPHEFETLRAVYEEPSGSATATATTLNFRTWFIDAYGSVTTTYTQGSRVYVRLEDHNFNDPAQRDREIVRVRTSQGDDESLELLETGKTTGIYEGSIELDGANPPSSGDGRLQASPGDELETERPPYFDTSPARARIESVSISFIDETGRPTVELLENGTARVRVISPDANGSPGQVDGLIVQLRSFYAGDQEDLPLAETGPDTGVFEGSIQLSFNLSSISQGNGVLETGNQGPPAFLREQVTASYGPFSATARMVGARVVFIDGFGRETTAFPLGSPVRVRVTDPTRDTTENRDTTYIYLTSCQGDQESFELTETGFTTDVFEGQIASGAQSVSNNDGTLQGTEPCLIRAFYYNSNSPVSTEAQATFTGGEMLFVDAQGQPASVFLEGTRAYLRVVDHGRSGSVPVTVTAELSGDLEPVMLQQVAPGVFEGSIELRSSPSGILQNGILETSYGGSPFEFDTLRAAYEDPPGTFTATASTLGFRLWFIDAYGSVTSSYAQGSRVYVRLESHNNNDPSRFDQYGVTVRTSRGDVELLQVLETGKTTGIYEGWLDLDGVNAPSPPVDGRLQAGPGDELEAQLVPEVPAIKARVESVSISFIDEAGRPTVELLENGMARVRVVNPDNNTNPSQVDGLVVQLSTLYTGDQEQLTLAETGPDTGVFEGSIPLHFSFSSSNQNDGVLQTGNQGPAYPGEQVTASYGPYSATARTRGSRVVFIDSFGRETTTFPLGSPVRVRVTDPTHNAESSRDSTYISLTSCQGDQESFQLTETNFNTGVFEGEIASRAQSVSYNDGTLQGTESCLIRAFYYNYNAPVTTEAQATFTGGEVLFLDAQGQPASVYLEGTRAYLRVVDHGRSGSVPVMVTAELSGDVEPVMLSETAPGVFEGSIELKPAPSGLLQNGILETSEAAGPPHEFETLRVVYDEPSGSSTATASTLNFRVWFIDAYGNVVDRYAHGFPVYVRLEDHNFNDPARFDQLGVTVRSSRGDEEPLLLLETGKSTGVYEGVLSTQILAPVSPVDGNLQAEPGDELEARVDTRFNAAPALARIDFAGLSFVDETGRPTVELLENGTARVRMLSVISNTSQSQADGVTVELRTFYTGDREDLFLTETGPSTNIFEGSIRLRFSFLDSQGNGVLETGNRSPEYLGEQVTASYGPLSATARTIGSRVVFIDGFGRETTAFPLGSPVRVRVTDPTRNTEEENRDTTYVTLTSCDGDQESFQINEAGFNTGIFEGEIPSRAQSVSYNDGTLQGTESCLIRAFYYNSNSPISTEARATFTGGEVLFVDAQGQPASVYLEGTRAYLRVVDHGRSNSVPVMVTAELSGDVEPVLLGETAPGVFEGSIELKPAPSGLLQNGILETSEAAGPPHEFETLRVVYDEPSGSSTATASTLNFRVWFIDAYGNVVDRYAHGFPVYVRLEDHNFNDPARFDQLGVTVRSSRGDEEPLLLLETGKSTGVYEGVLGTQILAPVSPVDGNLQAEPGDELEARVDTRFNAAPAKARIDFAGLSFVDETGRPTVELLENGTARVRMLSVISNTSPSQADGVVVELRTFYAGDREDLPLTETGPSTNVFEGSIRLRFNFSASQSNGVLETGNRSPEYLGDQVTASYGPLSATARTIGSRVVFIDGFGRETTAFPLGSPVRVRVTDPTRNTEEENRDTTYVTLTSCQGDQESFQINEAGFNTGVFEGEIPSRAQSVSYNDGTLQGTEPCLIRAFYYNTNAPISTEARATFTGGEVLFVDAQGQPASVYLEGTRAYLRVVDHGRGGSVPVMVTAELSGDVEPVMLGETAPGVFEGSIELKSAPSGFLQNGILETSEAAGPPHEFETLRVVYDEPSGSSTATASTLNFRVWFIDAYGNVVNRYAHGFPVYVRLEDHNFNDPAQIDQLGVTVRSSRGEEEPLLLQETGSATGVYEGALDTQFPAPVSPVDGLLQAEPGDELEARVDTRFNAAPAKARIEFAALSFIDEAGRPTIELLENGTARVRMLSVISNTNPSQADRVTVELGTSYTGDREDLFLTETGPSTNVFEGSIQLSFNFSASQSNGVLETGNRGPEYSGEQVTASYGPISATAHTVGSRVAFLNLRGQPVTSYSLGATVRVRVEAPSRAQSPDVDSFSIQVRSLPGGDQEVVAMTETSPVSGIFEGSLPSAPSAGSSDDGVLSAGAGDVVEATQYNANAPGSVTARATFLSNLAPQAVNDTAQTVEDQPVIVPVLANDSDPESGPLTVASVTQGAKGATTVNPDGTVTYTSNAGETGEDTFTYLVTDEQGGEAVATVTVTILPADHPPVANADTATVTEDDPATAINVLANDTDMESDPFTIQSVTQPANGTVVITGGGTGLTYQPNPNYCNSVSGTPDTFTYTLTPGGSTATVSMTVTCVDDNPVAVADAATVAEDSGATAVNVLANDTDVDGGPKSIQSVTQPANGTVVITGGGTGLTYTPNASYCGPNTFTYTLTPGGSTATVSMTVTCVDDNPVAVADTATVTEDSGANAVNVLANDTDVDGGPISIASVTQPANGTVVITGGGTGLTYTPNASYCGPDTFTYTLTPGGSTATVSMTVTCVDDNPVAVADTATVTEDSGANAVNVLANDTDVDGGPISIASVTQPANGTVVITGGGTGLTYTPNASYCGPDTFTYTLTPGGSTATVSVTVTCQNDAPAIDLDADDSQGTTGADFAITFTEGEAAKLIEDPTDATVTDVDNTTLTSLTVTITNLFDTGNEILSTDVTGTSITATYVTVPGTPGTGTLTLTGPDTLANFRTVLRKVRYLNTDTTPDTTPRVIQLVANDGTTNSNTATSTVTVISTDNNPTAVADSATVNEDSTNNAINVLANDTDPDGGPISIQSVTQPANGTVVITGGGTGLTYQPNPNYCNSVSGTPDTFTYTLTPGGSTATVSVTVTCVDDNPVAVADSATVAEDSGANAVNVLANDTDVDGGPKSIQSVTQPANGTVVITGGGTGLTYTPNANYCGPNTFTYTLTPGGSTATVSVTVTCVDDNPVAVADAATVTEDSGANAINVLANDTDPDGGPKSIQSVTQPAKGTVVITGGGTGLTYTPNANYCNSVSGTPDTFTYTLTPGGSTATVSVTVTCVNDNPVAVADSATVAEDGTVDVSVLSNDTDLENNTLTVTSVTQGAHGTVSINANQTVKYTPQANYNGSDSFTYTISDGNGGTSTATVAVTVTAINDAPTANADTTSVAEDGAVNVTVLANDTDPENNTLSVASVTQGAHGTVSINPDKTVRYAPALNYNGSDSFTYTVSDGNGGTATAAVSVTVTPVNDAPVAVNDTATVAAGSAVTIPVRANDTDVDGPSLTVTAVTQGARGSVTINAGQTVTYTATLSPGTDDTFTYTVSDGAGGTSTATVSVILTAPPRVTTDLQVRYNFSEGSGSTVTDTSGVGTPLNLTISPTSAVSWLPGALSVNSATVISSAGAATKVIDAVRTSSAITVEAWVAADNLTQTGPARIVSINKNSAQSNIIFGQSANRYETQTSTASGTRTQQTPVNSASTSLKHVVYTRNSGGLTVMYIDGVQVASTTATGAMSNWDTSMKLALANAIGGGKPWVGDLHLVAIYSRSLTATEVQQNFLAGSNAN